MSTFPSFAYPVSPLLGDAPMQAIGGATRPWCATLSCAAAWCRGAPLRGVARKLTREQQLIALQSTLRAHGIPDERQERFVGALLGERMQGMNEIDPHFGGLTASDYQLHAVQELTIAGGLLGMSVGLGKTVTACVAARHFAQTYHSYARCWIVCPLNAMGTWQKYIPELQKTFADVRVISIDSAHKLTGADRTAGGVLIIDEVHNAGHDTARRTKGLFSIRAGFDFCLGLTGTLLHSGVEPALTMLDLVLPGAACFANKYEAGAFFHCLVKKKIGNRTRTGLEKPTGENRQRFLEFMRNYAVVLTKHSEEVRRDILIPEQRIHTVEVSDPDGETVEDCIVRIAISMIDPDTGELPHEGVVLHAALREGAAEKLGWVMDNIDTATEPVVLFAEYHDTLTLIREALDAAGIKYAYVDGSITGGQRVHEVERFQSGEVPVFVGQIDAAGAAIDLFRAHISITIDHTQKANNYAQSLGRTCRRGQVHDCMHFDVIANQLQKRCIDRLRAGQDFHLELSKVKKIIDSRPIYA